MNKKIYHKKVQAKKYLGQHFLTDSFIALQIIDSLIFQKGMNVLEIGAGRGALTEFLVEKEDICFKAVEIDKDSIEYVEKKFHCSSKLIFADILQLEWEKIFPKPDYSFSIIGNFPYNISSPLFFKMMDYMDCVETVVCMLQREVALRIVSSHNSKQYGILSVLLQAFYEVEYLFSVPPDVFQPIPKVHSAVIRMVRKKYSMPLEERKKFKKFVKTAFSMRRKTVKNNLKNLYPIPPHPSEQLSKHLLQRAEQIPVHEFIALHQYFSNHKEDKT